MVERVRLSALADRGSLIIGDGYRTKAAELGRPGLPILRVAEVQDGHLTPTFGDHVREEFLAKIGAKVSKLHDVVVTTKGTVGRVSRITRADPAFVYSPQVCFFRALDSTVDPRWLYYWFRGPEFVGQARGVQGQTDMADYINLQDMRSLFISLPDVVEQEEIAETLGALDDKIDSNRRAIDLLDQLASMLWQKACLAGTERATASDLIAAGQLLIGDGYRAKNSELGTTGLPFVRAADLRDGFNLEIADRLDDEGAVRAGDKVSQPGDVVFTSKGTVGRFAYVSDSVPQMVYSPQLCYWRSLDPDVLPPAVLYYWLRSDEASAQLNALKGQTDMADYVSLRDQRGMWMSLPIPSVARHVANDLAVLLGNAGARRAEISMLAMLRDALLPELLSGRIRVPEAREAVDAAT